MQNVPVQGTGGHTSMFIRTVPAGPCVVILMVALLTCAVPAAPLGSFFQRTGGQKNDSVENTRYSALGPWGRLEVIRINTEPPEEFVARRYQYGTLRWVFPNHTKEQLARIFSSSGLDKDRQKQLWKNSYENPLEGVWIFYPEAGFVLGLAPQVRKNLYLELAKFEVNRAQNDPFRWRADSLEEWFDNGGLSPGTIALIKKLLYFRGQAALFADPELVLSTLETAQERVQFLKTMSRQSTLLVKLLIQPDSDIDGLTEYWGRRGRSKDVRALLDSLIRVPGGCSLDIVHLLPRFPRRLLYTYPVLAKDFIDPLRDCNWTSMNFWNDPPDNRLGSDQKYSEEVLQRNYVRIAGPYTFGDLLFFADGKKLTVHSAVYIADDIVFTKNGSSITSPWILMRMQRLAAFYEDQNDDLQILAYRRKE